MRWADALRASNVGRARRGLSDSSLGHDGSEPNVILTDPKSPRAPKLFRAMDSWGWRRLPLKLADERDDWEPVVEEVS